MRQKLIYDYFYNKAFNDNKAVSVMIELLTTCNLNCKHCYLPAHNNEGLPFETVKKLLYDLKKMGVVNVSLTGGEVFLRKDLFKIIELARSLYMRVYILSNGTILDKEKIERLKELHISEFSTTIFSMNPEIHDYITERKGSLEKLLSNIDALKEAGIPVRIKTPLMDVNKYEFEEVYNYCNSNGFEYMVSPLIFSKNDGDDAPKELRVNDESLYKIMKKVDAITRNEHLHVKDVPCAAIFYSFAIDCNGNVFPCNSFLYKVGNIYNDDIDEIWNNSEELKTIKSIRNSDLKICENCYLCSECDRCPGMVYLEKNDLLSCDEFSKKIATIRHCDYGINNKWS